MTSHDNVGLQVAHVLAAENVAFLKNRTVPRDHRFVAVLLGIGGVAEQVVAGKHNSLAVDIEPQRAAIFGLPWHPIDLNFVAFPIDAFTVAKTFVDFHAVEAILVSSDQGGVVVSPRVFALVDDAIQRPRLRAVLSFQDRPKQKVIAMHVRNPERIDLL